MSIAIEWAASSGDAWAQRWRETDRALAELGAELDALLLDLAPSAPFRALDIGCGPGTTALHLARSRADASIVACDLSPALVDVARERLAGCGSATVVLGNAERVAEREGPFDLIFSRHGVMFFDDPVRAFRTMHASASTGAALAFSCFQDWEANPWASELASAAAGRALPPPGREPSGFAFAEPAYVRQILSSAGWTDLECRPVPFRYVAAEGGNAVDDGLSFLTDIGPASRLVRELPEAERPAALRRMREVLDKSCRGAMVEFTAAAWIWTAKAGGQ